MKVQIVIMCKAPVAGKVKTRLIGDYCAEEVAKLYADMASTVIGRADRLFDHVCIATDDPSHPFFAAFNLLLKPQGEGDLGARMDRLMRQAFSEGADAVLFLGTDSPHMPDSRLLQAVSALHSVDVVIGPVEDGGFDLIAMKSVMHVFEGVAWSSGRELEQTLSHIRDIGLSCLQLDVAFDVDHPEDIERAVQAGWKAGW